MILLKNIDWTGKKILGVIFLFALVLRFLFFPGNLYFGYDQARDAFEVKEILGGNIKVLGPSTSVPGLYHGVFYYYLIAPFYFLGQGNPEFVSAVLRIFNALGVFVIFYIGKIIFDKKVGILAALFYAFSFEQSQFAIYLSNPAPASVVIPLMFLGLSMVIFANKKYGLPLAAFCLGLSIQFEFALFYLIVPFIIVLAVYYKSFTPLSLKIWGYTLISFLISVSTFILAEFKYSFRTISTLFNYSGTSSNVSIIEKIKAYLFTLDKMGEFNLYGSFYLGKYIWLSLLLGVLFFVWKRKDINKIAFLIIWFFSLVTVYLTKGGYSDLYYTNVGISGSLLIFISFLITQIKKKYVFFGIAIILLIAFANIAMVLNLNPKGTVSQIHVQQGMLFADEKIIVDKMYKKADGVPFAVKGVTLPYNINTTWSYMFEWYGARKYGYLPVWNGPSAEGFKGNLKIESSQDNAPAKRFLIIEPVRGVPGYLIDNYLKEESYFTKVVSEENIGKFVLQERVRY